MLFIITPINFTRNSELIRIKQEDHILSMSNVGLIFFLAISCQLNTSKIGITILSLFQLKLCNLQNRNHLKSIYLATFYSPRKILETVHLIFLSNTTLQDETNKIWFTKIGYSQLEICIFETCIQICEINQKINSIHTNSRGP